MPGLPEIRVTDMSTARELLRDGWATRAVGVTDPDFPAMLDAEHYLVLRFHDVNRVARHLVAPCIDDIERAFEHVKGMGEGDRLLVHCMTATGRGPAMAIALLAFLGVPPEDAVRRVGELRPAMEPNGRVLRIADRLLDNDHALEEALVAWEPSVRTSRR